MKNRHQLATQSEIKNEHGIMQDSVLNTKVIQAIDLPSGPDGGPLDPYCVMEFGEQFIETKVQYKTLNPVWNEGFEFDVSGIESPPQEAEEKLIVKVFDKGTVPNSEESDEYIGIVEINVRDLADQTEKEDWYDLTPLEGSSHNFKSKINLSLWWVYSKVDVYKNLIDKCDEDLTTLDENLFYYQDRIQLLQIPLNEKKGQIGSLVPPSHFSQANAYAVTASPDHKSAENDMPKLGALASLMLESKRHIANGFENHSDRLFIKLGFDETPWYTLFQLCMYTYIVLTFI